MRIPDIVTPRLRLSHVSLELMQTELSADRQQQAQLLNAIVPAAWPPEHWEPHCFPFLEKMYAEHPHTESWARYIVLRGEPETLVGTLGAFPRGRKEAEIGYGILPDWQRRGLTTEAARALITELFRDEWIEAISAQTYPRLRGSIGVMERCGMRPFGPGNEEGTVRYRLERQAPDTSPPPG